MTENTAYNSTQNRTRYIGIASLTDLLALNPATLLRLPNHGAHRRHIRFEQAFIVATTVVVNGLGDRRETIVVYARISTDRTD